MRISVGEKGRPAVSREADLVLLGAREVLSPAVRKRILDGVTQDLDQQALRRICLLQKASPLVLRSILAAHGRGPGCKNESIIDVLRPEALHWRSWRRRIAKTMWVVRETMKSTRARFAFIKGIAFAERYYRFPLLRMCNDVDMLIPEQNREEVEQALADVGFRLHPCQALHRARVEYVGQTEFRHPGLRMLLDVNYRLTGNGAIGSVSQDMDTVWARAVHVEGNEWRLSDEDTLLNLIRHVGHGHDFDTGLIQACVDVAAILRTCGSTLDADYICEQARQCECLRIVRFFAHFFDTYYRDDSMPSLMECLPGLESCASERECRLFARAVLVPLVRRKHWRKAAFGIVYGNFRVAAKFWALDRFRRLLRMMAWTPWPTKHQLVMLTLEYHTESYWRRRIRFYFNPFLFILPGLFVGIAARLAVEASRAVRKCAAFLTGWPSPRTKRPSAEDVDVFATSGTGLKPVLLPGVNPPRSKAPARGNGEDPCGPES